MPQLTLKYRHLSSIFFHVRKDPFPAAYRYCMSEPDLTSRKAFKKCFRHSPYFLYFANTESIFPTSGFGRMLIRLLLHRSHPQKHWPSKASRYFRHLRPLPDLHRLMAIITGIIRSVRIASKGMPAVQIALHLFFSIVCLCDLYLHLSKGFRDFIFSSLSSAKKHAFPEDQHSVPFFDFLTFLFFGFFKQERHRKMVNSFLLSHPWLPISSTRCDDGHSPVRFPIYTFSSVFFPGKDSNAGEEMLCSYRFRYKSRPGKIFGFPRSFFIVT